MWINGISSSLLFTSCGRHRKCHDDDDDDDDDIMHPVVSSTLRFSNIDVRTTTTCSFFLLPKKSMLKVLFVDREIDASEWGSVEPINIFGFLVVACCVLIDVFSVVWPDMRWCFVYARCLHILVQTFSTVATPDMKYRGWLTVVRRPPERRPHCQEIFHRCFPTASLSISIKNHNNHNTVYNITTVSRYLQKAI